MTALTEADFTWTAGKGVVHAAKANGSRFTFQGDDTPVTRAKVVALANRAAEAHAKRQAAHPAKPTFPAPVTPVRKAP